MTDTTVPSEIEDWDGALGPQSESDPMFFEFEAQADSVRLVGPSPGTLYEYDREEFEALVDKGEWILADDDWENEVYRTPDGDQPY